MSKVAVDSKWRVTENAEISSVRYSDGSTRNYVRTYERDSGTERDKIYQDKDYLNNESGHTTYHKDSTNKHGSHKIDKSGWR